MSSGVQNAVQDLQSLTEQLEQRIAEIVKAQEDSAANAKRMKVQIWQRFDFMIDILEKTMRQSIQDVENWFGETQFKLQESLDRAVGAVEYLKQFEDVKISELQDFMKRTQAKENFCIEIPFVKVNLRVLEVMENLQEQLELDLKQIGAEYEVWFSRICMTKRMQGAISNIPIQNNAYSNLVVQPLPSQNRIHVWNLQANQYELLQVKVDLPLDCRAISYGDVIFVLGGKRNTQKTKAALEVFRTGKVNSLPDMNHGRSHLSCCIAGRYLYAIGGEDNSEKKVSIVERMNIEERKVWEVRSSMPKSLSNVTSINLEQKVLVIGGAGLEKIENLS